MPRQLGQQGDDVGRDRPRMELAAEVLGDLSRVREFIVGGVVEPDRNRHRRPRAGFDHVRHHRARIDPAGEEGAERHVADLPEADRLAEQGVELFEILCLAAGIAAAAEFEVPVARHADGATFGDQDVPGLELADAAINRRRRRDVQQRQVGIDRRRTPVARHVGIFEQRLQLRAEDHAAAGQFGEVERLDADPIARQHQPPRRRVPDGEGKHAAELLDAALAPLLVAVDDDLGVGAGAELVAMANEFGAHLREVVNLAVEDGPDGAVLVGQRLIAGRQIDDAQPAMAQPDPGGDVVAGRVGTAVSQGIGHRLEDAAIDQAQCVVIESSGNTAHRQAAREERRRARCSRPASRDASSCER